MLKMRPASWLVLSLALLPWQAMASCGSAGASNDPARVVDAQFAAYNAHDVEALRHATPMM